MTDIKALIAGARRPETTVTLHLDTGLVAEHERVERELKAEQERVVDSLAGNPRVRELTGQLAELEERMQESRIDFRLRALSPKRWAALRAEHPPRKGDDGEVLPSDRVLGGVYLDAFAPVLLRACVIAPELDESDWESLLGDDGLLTDGQYNKLAGAAIRLNESDVDIPFSLAVSKMRRSEPT